MQKRWVVVLKLSRLSVPKKVEKARLIVTSMTGNAKLPSPNPPLADIANAADELEKAALAAQGGGKDETAIMHEKDVELERLLIAEGHYVEDTANASPKEAESIILSAGMEFKQVPVHTAKEFHVENGKLPGEANLRTKFVPNAAFIWQFRLSTVADWTNAPMTNKASTVISGLTSAIRYSFRVAILKSNVQGAWSDVVELIVL